MTTLDRDAALDRAEAIVETVATEIMPVPVREVWVYGDVALGMDPVDRLNVYVTKDLLFGRDEAAAERFRETHGVEGVGQTVRAEWAQQYPEYVRANQSGHVAPEQCLAAHLLEPDEPVHLEVCNASFEDNVTQRLEGARARGNYEQLLDPRGVCLWLGDGEDSGRRSDDAVEKLRDGSLAFPTLADALSMLGMDDDEAREAADAVEAYRDRQDGRSVRGDVV
ncbi:DUF7095 family protein [Halapricum hydrolyticum]|uniref:Uncharacterized protein n=1 Tax=Halapricum hydrolyticum TaxID=2979991 RepID=A0AAE3LIW2_9EURY|nr:hypothetical protein [Halapricum hydrolyticum]MCU4717559.1 hypothetical protein [Halapricum hydrolyticum]MCU4726723.1 hypothetical protein [Halapricum hydrolyticum]